MIIGVVSGDNMAILKKQLLDIWSLYRKCLDKKVFLLGKQ